jgi:hypothetical protein
MPETPITCNLSLEELTKTSDVCANNASGVKAVYLAMHTDVASFPTLPSVRSEFADFAVLEGTIVMVAGKLFKKIYVSKDMGELKYKPQGKTGSRSLRASLSIFHPGLKAKLLGMVASMMNSEFYLAVLLENGDVHILGDKYRGAEFSEDTELTSGKEITSENGGNLGFIYDTPTAQIYTGGLDALTTVVTP